MAKKSLRRRNWREHGILIDWINVVLSVLILVSSVFLMIDIHKYMFMFPVIFFLSGIMNICLGIKKYKMDQYAASIISIVAALLLIALSIFALIVVL